MKFKLTRTVFPIPSAARASDPASCEGRDASSAMAMANRRGGRLSPRTRSGRTPKRLHSGVTRAGGSWASPSALRASTCGAARPRDGRTSRSLPSSSSPPSRSPEPMTCLLCTSRFVARCQAVVRSAGLARTFANFRPGKYNCPRGVFADPKRRPILQNKKQTELSQTPTLLSPRHVTPLAPSSAPPKAASPPRPSAPP